MNKQIIEVGNDSIGEMLKLYTKAVLPKKVKNQNSLPNVIYRKSSFDFDKTHLDYFINLVGFNKDSSLIPSIYINLVGFKLQMYLLLHQDFPYSVLGMVHVSNKIIQHRPFKLSEIEKVEAYFDEPKKHNRGIAFTIITKTYGKNDELLAENHADQLKILTKGEKSSEPKKDFVPIEGETTSWFLAENIGRNFSKVSGDRNPIHMFKIAAQLFGFKRHIAHGMYSVSKGLAELDKKLSNNSSFEYYTEFKQPVFLPGSAHFIIKSNAENSFDFELISKDKTKLHMNGFLKTN